MSAQAEIGRFVAYYQAELNRTGFRPDQTSTRDTRIAFLQQTVKRFCSPMLAMKRADPTRPISDEVVVFVQAGAEYRTFADFLISGGSAAWKLSDHVEGILPVEQPLVNPITLDRLPENTLAPTVPGCTGPGPSPGPTPGLISRDEFYARFKQVNDYYAAQEGLQRPGGMVIDTATPVRADHEAMGAWGYDLMLGKSVNQCITEIRQSDEWKAKHPGETP